MHLSIVTDKIFKVFIHKRNRRCYVVECPDCKEIRFETVDNIKQIMKKYRFTGRCNNCHSHLRYNKSGGWKGGKHLGSSARYIYITVNKNHKFYCMANCRNEIAEHRLKVAEKIGRALKRYEHVHHIDGNRLNNDINNLILMKKKDHLSFHKLLEYGKIKRNEVMAYSL